MPRNSPAVSGNAGSRRTSSTLAPAPRNKLASLTPRPPPGLPSSTGSPTPRNGAAPLAAATRRRKAQLYNRNVTIMEKALGPEDPHSATSLSNLASLSHSEGRYAEALPLGRDAVAMKESAAGRDNEAAAVARSKIKDRAASPRAVGFLGGVLAKSTKSPNRPGFVIELQTKQPATWVR